MKNKLTDLNDHLFAQLERLGDEDLTGEELQKEVTRAKAINDVAANIVSNAQLLLDAEALRLKHSGATPNVPALIGLKENA